MRNTGVTWPQSAPGVIERELVAKARARPTVDERPSVLIVSATMGAGHDGVAYELQDRLRARGAEAEVVDYLTLLPSGVGPFYRSMYEGQLKYAPSSYEWLYGRIDRGLLAPVARWLGQMGKRPVRRLVREGGYDLVVSTYPLGCQATGALRKAGKLDIPAVGFLTDVDVHGLWLHAGVDLNLAVYQGSAQIAQSRVGTPSHAVGPVLPATFREPVTAAERTDARARLGISDPGTVLVLVVAGSWGVGNVARTARAIAASGVGIPVVLCGRNDELRAELDRDDVGIALGWTKDMRAVLAASDVMVHNAGGLSCLEGFAVGIPVVGHACLPGHGHRNAEAMRDAGVAALADTTQDLIDELRRLAGTTQGAQMAARARALFLSDPTDELLALAGAGLTVPASWSQDPTRRSASWAKRAVAMSVTVPVAMGSLSFGSAFANDLHVGIARAGDAVYAAALLNRAQLVDPVVLAALRRGRVSAAIRHLPTNIELAALGAASVTFVGADGSDRHRTPDRQREDLDAAARTGLLAGDLHPKVVCLREPSVVEKLFAYKNHVRLAQATAVIAGGAPLHDVDAGAMIVLDERHRTTAQVIADMAALGAATTAEQLPQEPLRTLWAKA